jgi:hypothetical protein
MGRDTWELATLSPFPIPNQFPCPPTKRKILSILPINSHSLVLLPQPNTLMCHLRTKAGTTNVSPSSDPTPPSDPEETHNPGHYEYLSLIGWAGTLNNGQVHVLPSTLPLRSIISWLLLSLSPSLPGSYPFSFSPPAAYIELPTTIGTAPPGRASASILPDLLATLPVWVPR